jgi:hypothetical protein
MDDKAPDYTKPQAMAEVKPDTVQGAGEKSSIGNSRPIEPGEFPQSSNPPVPTGPARSAVAQIKEVIKPKSG